jgi:uncharacterized protein (TIGR03067 family)
VAGTVAGKREGNSMPHVVVDATDKTINLPTLSKTKGMLYFLGAMSYTLDPGLKEAHEQVESAEEQLKWLVLAQHRHRIEHSERTGGLPDPSEIDDKTRFDVAKTALWSAERRRDERKANGSAEESRIDMEAGPGGGKALRGIYQLKDDILTICYDEADRGRPETFAINKPSERLIILGRRRSAPAPHPGGPLPKPTGPDVGRSR